MNTEDMNNKETRECGTCKKKICMGLLSHREHCKELKEGKECKECKECKNVLKMTLNKIKENL